MTHLKIEQNNSAIEQVSSAVIEKLYKLATSGELDLSSDLVGRLHTTATYLEYIDELTTTYLDLYISADKYYVMFADSEVLRILLTNGIGDGNGIDALALLLTTIIGSLDKSHSYNSEHISGALTDGVFLDNTLITQFNELKKFTNITKLDYQAFSGCSNLTSIDLTNIVLIGSYGGLGYCAAFKGCSSLTNLYMPNLMYIKFSARDYYNTFGDCTSLISIDMPSAVNDDTYNISNGYAGKVNGFSYLTSLLYVNFGHFYGDFEVGNQWNSGSFNNNPSLKVIDYGDNVYKLGDWHIQNCPNIEAVVLRNNSIVSVSLNKGTASVANMFGNANVNIYVPDSLVTSYQADSYWSSLSSNILPLSTYDKSDYITT